MQTRKCRNCAALQLEVRPTGDQSFCALIMIYYAAHGSAHVWSSSSSGFPYRLVELPSKTWHSRRSYVCDHAAEMLELSSVHHIY